MNSVASDVRSSSYMRGVASPNPFGASAAARKHGAAAATPSPSSSMHRAGGDGLSFSSLSGSPIASLVKELNSSLHLDTSTSSTHSQRGAEPFVCQSVFESGRAQQHQQHQQHQQTTPLLLRSRKRQMEDLSSPGGGMHMNSPTAAFWARKQQQQQHSRGLSARGSMLTFNVAGAPSLSLFRRESLNTDEESSFDDDGSLTSLPRMRNGGMTAPAAGRGRRCEAMEFDCNNTPSRPHGGSIMKRARSQASGISMGFQAIMEEPDSEAEMPLVPAPTPQEAAGFSPFARSQAEFYKLPCATAATDSIMRIEAETARELLTGRYSDLYDEKIVVDCRFPYEYEGGHIAGAANAPTMDALERLLLDRPRTDKRVVVVLHCEYSIQRAPSMACHLRRRDREVNMHRYPYLHYPEIYVLKGGYRNFFNFHKGLCEPQNYVEMNDRAYSDDCKQRMLQFNRQFKRTKSMNDAALCRANSLGSAKSLAMPLAAAGSRNLATGSRTVGAGSRTLAAEARAMAAGSRTVGAEPRTVAGSSAALFMSNAQSPTNMAGRLAPGAYSSSSLPVRPRRIGRTQSARPGINSVDFTQIK
ncbi:m-phase inducer phosphatase [Coemansia thaxteri]|uniref:M-phase inducer phosphatase n=1 Tax=Coemansia thaxteri TaxID=2663907 RepID=A0A9W8EKG0_9FUNG|nr:m-phase inducer phosphatase [Coemansia thaxteri]KAJ2488227.1 m-phase inducer phosphatase [Coemansia sp. RSA 2320]